MATKATVTSKVGGRVVVHETGQGVPNVIVAAYDVPRGLFRTRHSLDFDYVATHGRSLGSALTEAGGAFEIPMEFSSRSAPRDVRIAIVVTLGAAGCNADHDRVTSETRVLSLTSQPKAGLGAKETFILRIPRSRIEAIAPVIGMQLAPDIRPIREVKPPSPEQVLSELEESHRFVPVSRTKIDQADYALAGRELEIYNRVRRYDEDLPDKSVTHVQKSIIESTFEQLKHGLSAAIQSIEGVRPESAESSDSAILIPRAIRTNITRAAAESLGFAYDEETGEPQQAFVRKPFNEFRRWLPPLRMSAPDNAVVHVVERAFPSSQTDKKRAEAESTGGDLLLPRTPPSDPSVTDADLQAFKELLKCINTNDAEQKVDPENSRSKPQTALYESLNDGREQQLTSAADTVAYHDFYDLKIAWQPIWSEALGASLYGQVSIPEDVSAFLPGITQEQWRNYLTNIDSLDSDSREIERAAAQFFIYRELYLIANDGIDVDTERLERLAGKAGMDASWVTSRAQAFLDGWNQFKENSEYIKVGGEASDYNLDARNLQTEWRARFDAIASIDPGSRTTFARDAVDIGYDFRIFAPGSVNYGLLINYRQEWKPQNWQVGELVETIPLAPKESRKYTKKVKRSKKRSRKEVENSLSVRRSDDSTTSRAEAEIVQTAQEDTDFQATANGGIKIKVSDAVGVNVGGSTTFNTSAGSDSSETKRKFRDAVAKSAREFKEERKLEISTEETQETELSTVNEISNPNEEITVTYLFYELERLYQVAERLHSFQSVVLVANEVPAPNDINWPWILAHDWILKRVLLDDSFRLALDIVLGGQAAMDATVSALEAKKNQLTAIVDSVRVRIAKLEDRAEFEEQDAKMYGDTLASLTGRSESFVEDLLEGLLGGGSAEGSQIEANELRSEQALERLDRITQKLKGTRDTLATSRSVLERAVDAYNQAVQDRARKFRHVERLRQHIRDNILYYMQAIWSHEPPDQRYLRLFDRTVSFVEYPPDDEDVIVRVQSATGALDGIEPGTPFEVVMPPPQRVVARRLAEIADLDSLLGFKGNYMIFPLRVQSYLTAYMAQSYVGGSIDEKPGTIGEVSAPTAAILGALELPVPGLELADPDSFAVSSADIRSAAQELFGNVPSEIETTLDELTRKGLLAPESEPMDIIVPTGSLYIEALPGKHPILEDFKLRHRMIDVAKVAAEVRAAEIENVRRAKRVIAGDFSDADVEKHIVVEGDGVSVTAPIGVP